jgi:hypothetical protein
MSSQRPPWSIFSQSSTRLQLTRQDFAIVRFCTAQTRACNDPSCIVCLLQSQHWLLDLTKKIIGGTKPAASRHYTCHWTACRQLPTMSKPNNTGTRANAIVMSSSSATTDPRFARTEPVHRRLFAHSRLSPSVRHGLILCPCKPRQPGAHAGYVACSYVQDDSVKRRHVHAAAHSRSLSACAGRTQQISEVQDRLVPPTHSAIYVTSMPLRTWSNPQSMEAKVLR